MLIAPSILTADFLQLQKAVDMLNGSEADWFHLDVMDGRFVPNISFGMAIISQIRKATTKVCDVHLMIVEPEKYIADFAKAGADNLTVHAEACVHLHRTLQQIKEHGMKAGVALNPHTPVEVLQDIIQDIDVVLIMSVNPGFGGQQFIEHTYNKVWQLRQMIDAKGLQTLIEIDGGVSLDNAGKLKQAGATVLVAGNAVFSATDPVATIHRLKTV
jgi:ribulose-phosphate 3-epimerase